jgi:NMD protein affecting ribosome stability and mRNA decay
MPGARRATKGPAVARKHRRSAGDAVCHRCGAIFAGKTWRREHKVSLAFYDRARWVLCDACKQSRRAEGFGRVAIRGAWVGENEEALLRRVRNVAARAEFTQPQRRITSIGTTDDGLEVLTTSQKLAHRIARELVKAFQGRVTYAWSDRDGSLLATWSREAASVRPRGRKTR